MKTLYKIIPSELYKRKYPDCPTGIAFPYGQYITNIENILGFLQYGDILMKVSVPDDAELIDNVTIGDGYENAPLHWYTKEKLNVEFMEVITLDVIKSLILKGANPNVYNDSAFVWAADKSKMNEMFYLYDNYNVDIHTHNEAALWSAIEHDDLNVIRYLIDKGADYHIDNDAMFLYAVLHEHIGTVRILMGYGVDLHACDAVNVARRAGIAPMVKFLLSFGTFIEYNDDEIKAKEA